MIRQIICLVTLTFVHSRKVNTTSPTPKNVSEDCECGESNTLDLLNTFENIVSDGDVPGLRFIVNGITMQETQHPFLALVKRQGYLQCGGSVLNSRYILTAAHCFVKGETEKDYSVVLGVHDRLYPEDHSQEYRIEKIKKHEAYKNMDTGIVNDIALLKLAKDIVYSKFIQPICLPPAVMVDDKGYIQGWGKTGSEESTTLAPLEATLYVMSGEECTKYPVNVEDPRTVLCAQRLFTDSCMGDSGGPLITLSGVLRTSVLSGIVSYGVGCAQPGYPGVYTKVEAFLDWIYNHTEDAIYCSRKRIVQFERVS